MPNIDSSEVRSFFGENGFYFAKSLYSVGEIQHMEKDFDRALAQILDTEKNSNSRWGGKLMDELDGGDSLLFHTHNIQSFSAIWLNAFMKPEFLSVAEAILGPDIILHHSKLFCKPPEKGSPFPMHQDWQYFPSVKDTMIAAVIYVSEATDEMGCIRVHPGSHKLGRCQGMMGQRTKTSRSPTNILLTKEQCWKLTPEMSFSSAILHYTVRCPIDHPRRGKAFCCRCMPVMTKSR